MQTIAFVKLLQDIIKRLRVVELTELLQPILDSGQSIPVTDELRARFAELVFEAREGYSHCINSSESRQIVDSLGVQKIFHPTQLAALLTIINSQNESAGIHGTPQHFALFQTFLSNLRVMVAFFDTMDQHLWKQRLTTIADNERILELEIIDYDYSGLMLGRLAFILESLHKLHTYVAKVMEDKSAKMSICYMDSGSDFVLGLQSSFKVSEIMRTLFNQFWQRIRFKSNDEIEKGLDHLGKNLNIIQHISRQEKNGAFDADAAAKLKSAILEEMLNLTGTGVCMKDYEGEEKFDRRKLLTEKRELKPKV